MRSLLWCWIWLSVATASLSAQQAEARIELSSGRILRGEVESIDSERLVLHGVAGREVIALSGVAAIHAEGDQRGLRLTRDPGEEPGVGVESPNSAPEPVATDGTGLEPGPDRELMRFLERYLWFLPRSNGHRTSLGAGVLVVLVLLVQLASRMANLENRSIGRASSLALLILATVALEVTFVPLSPGLIVAVVALDVAIWFVLGMAIFRADLFQAVVLLASFLLSAMVSVMLLQLAGVLVHAGELL